MKYRTKIRKGPNKLILCIEENKIFKEDYQLIMIRENHIKGLLPVVGKGIEDRTIYEYNITGKQSLRKTFENKNINVNDIKKIFGQVLEVVDQMDNYLLDPDGILLAPEYIFREGGEYYFCYCPGEKEDIRRKFHIFIQEFIRWIDYKDEESIKLIFYLYKETMQEDYCLQDLIKNQEQDNEVEIVRDYVEQEPKWSDYENEGKDLLRETDNLWLPVRKFLDQRKQPKWGDWDGIYIDDEEL